MKNTLAIAVLFAGSVFGQDICSSVNENSFEAVPEASCTFSAAGLSFNIQASWTVHYQRQYLLYGPIVTYHNERVSVTGSATCMHFGNQCNPTFVVTNNINTTSSTHEWRGYATDGRTIGVDFVCVLGLQRYTEVLRPL